MDVIVRPRFGRPCFEGCGATVPPQRSQRLADLANRRGEAFLPSDRVCVDCERKRRDGATVMRRPRY